MSRWHGLTAIAVLGVTSFTLGACHSSLPAIRFAPPGTDREQLRRDYALTDAERMALTPQSLHALTQAQVDQIYLRLSSGPIPDGPFRGDLFFPRDADGHARLRDVASPVPGALTHVAALRLEHFGRMLWRGKAFFRSQGILRNRIEDLAVLKPIIGDTSGIERLTFDGQTTWLLFPALLSCSESRLDPSTRSTVIDYSRGSEVDGLPRRARQARRPTRAEHPRRSPNRPPRLLSRPRLLRGAVRPELHPARSAAWRRPFPCRRTLQADCTTQTATAS